MIDVKKLREMAANQRAADSELNNSTPLTDTIDTAEPMFQDEVFVPMEEESFTNETDNSDAQTRESLESLIARCFDEKAYNIELERLIPFRKSIFTILGDISELKSDIVRVGITEPLLVRSAGNGEYEILSGTRRRAAAEELMWTKVPCRIGSNAELTDDCAARIVVETNRGRFSTLALSEQIRVAAVLGESAAAELGISPAQAEELIRLDVLEQEFLAMLDGNMITLPIAERLAGIESKTRQIILAALSQHPEMKLTSTNAKELSEEINPTSATVAKILKPKPPVKVAVPADIIAEYFADKTAEELTEMVTAALVKCYGEEGAQNGKV